MRLRNSKETAPPQPSTSQRPESPAPPREQPYYYGTPNDMRNWTCPENPTIEDTLRDVNPHTLEETFHWYAPFGSPVWILSHNKQRPIPRWRQGYIIGEDAKMVFSPKGIFRSYHVQYTIGGQSVVTQITPGLQPELKPDTPHVRRLLRDAGVAAAL